jgi:tetratricopeptide (TPR) repeat protein
MLDIGWFQLLVVLAVLGNLFVSIYPTKVEAMGTWRWLLFLALGAIVGSVELLRDRSPEHYFRAAAGDLQKAQEKVDADDPLATEIGSLRQTLESLADYAARRDVRYRRIFEEQSAAYPRCFGRLEAARRLRRSGQVDTAIPILRGVIKDCPDFYLGHYNLGLALEEGGLLADAEPYYARAAQLEDNLRTRDPSIHNTYAFLLLRLHSFQNAEKEYLKCLELDPGHPKCQTGLQAARRKLVF